MPHKLPLISKFSIYFRLHISPIKVFSLISAAIISGPHKTDTDHTVFSWTPDCASTLMIRDHTSGVRVLSYSSEPSFLKFLNLQNVRTQAMQIPATGEWTEAVSFISHWAPNNLMAIAVSHYKLCMDWNCYPKKERALYFTTDPVTHPLYYSFTFPFIFCPLIFIVSISWPLQMLPNARSSPNFHSTAILKIKSKMESNWSACFTCAQMYGLMVSIWYIYHWSWARH